MTELNKQQKELLFAFNKTEAAFPESVCLAELFENQCSLTPDAIAVEFGSHRLTYSQLNKKSNQIANWMVAQGVQPDQMVGICAERSIDLISGILGIIKSGAAYVPFDASYPSDRISYMLKESGIKTLLIQEQFRSIFIE